MMRLLRSKLPGFYEWLRQRDLLVLLAVLIVVLGLWGFIALSDQVRAGDTEAWDNRLLRALRQPDDPHTLIGPSWMKEVVRDVTALGGTLVLTLLTAAVGGYFWLGKKYHALLFVLVATLGGLAVSQILKNSFDRDRPTVVPPLSDAWTSSFPSGHSMLSAVVYLTLGALLARFVAPRRMKVYFLSLAMLLSFLVGISRVAMGVHYPTDVLAGWTAGLVWAVLCWLVARHLQRRGRVEAEVEED